MQDAHNKDGVSFVGTVLCPSVGEDHHIHTQYVNHGRAVAHSFHIIMQERRAFGDALLAAIFGRLFVLVTAAPWLGKEGLHRGAKCSSHEAFTRHSSTGARWFEATRQRPITIASLLFRIAGGSTAIYLRDLASPLPLLFGKVPCRGHEEQSLLFGLFLISSTSIKPGHNDNGP